MYFENIISSIKMNLKKLARQAPGTWHDIIDYQLYFLIFRFQYITTEDIYSKKK